jgi:hypothetical protein
LKLGHVVGHGSLNVDLVIGITLVGIETDGRGRIRSLSFAFAYIGRKYRISDGYTGQRARVKIVAAPTGSSNSARS